MAKQTKSEHELAIHLAIFPAVASPLRRELVNVRSSSPKLTRPSRISKPATDNTATVQLTSDVFGAGYPGHDAGARHQQQDDDGRNRAGSAHHESYARHLAAGRHVSA